MREAAGLDGVESTESLVARYWQSEDQAVWRLVEALALSGDTQCILALQPGLEALGR